MMAKLSRLRINMEQVLSVLSDHWKSNPHITEKKHCVYQEDKLILSEKFKYRKKCLVLNEGEKIYLHAGGKGYKSGFVFTNFGIHFDTFKDGFFSSLLMLPQGVNGFINYDDLKSIQIAHTDRCYGSNYFGNNLIINKEEVGLVRMSNGITYDEPAIKYCNQLFSKLVGICLDSAPDLESYPDTLI